MGILSRLKPKPAADADMTVMAQAVVQLEEAWEVTPDTIVGYGARTEIYEIAAQRWGIGRFIALVDKVRGER